MEPTQQYLSSLYYTITTITTVGYGDISGNTPLEKIFCIFIMIIGVVAFSFASGSLASILQNYDSSNAKYEEKLQMLNNVYKKYNLPNDLYSRLKQSFRFNQSKEAEDLNQFLEELPYKLKIELSIYLYEKTYSNITFF